MFLAACALFTGSSHAQIHVPEAPPVTPKIAPQVLPDGAARVISQSGRVDTIKSNGDMWAMMPNDIVPAGQEIISGPDGHAILELSDTSRVEVFPNSRLVFRAKMGVDLKDLMNLILGKVRIHIEKIGGQPNPYRMSSPTALIAVRGTTFEVTVDAADNTTVDLEEGGVDVTSRRSGMIVHLNPGQTTTIYANEPLAHSKGPTIGSIAKVAVRTAEQTIDILRQTRGVGGATTPTGTSGTGGTTTATNTPPSTTGGTTQSGTGTSNPPSNGRGNGSGNNGDTGSGSTGTGSGSSGSSGGGGGGSSAGPSSRPRP